jgi:hypothetical protein
MKQFGMQHMQQAPPVHVVQYLVHHTYVAHVNGEFAMPNEWERRHASMPRGTRMKRRATIPPVFSFSPYSHFYNLHVRA